VVRAILSGWLAWGFLLRLVPGAVSVRLGACGSAALAALMPAAGAWPVAGPGLLALRSASGLGLVVQACPDSVQPGW